MPNTGKQKHAQGGAQLTGSAFGCIVYETTASVRPRSVDLLVMMPVAGPVDRRQAAHGQNAMRHASMVAHTFNTWVAQLRTNGRTLKTGPSTPHSSSSSS